MILIICICVYTLSSILMYNWVHKAYNHPKGRWRDTTPDIVDLFVNFFPMVNTVMVIMTIFNPWKDKKYRNNNWIVNFYKQNK